MKIKRVLNNNAVISSNSQNGDVLLLGIQLKNPLKWDIARFYADEYAVGRKALEIIKHDLGVEMEDDEAAFIAVHFVNAQLSQLDAKAM